VDKVHHNLQTGLVSVTYRGARRVEPHRWAIMARVTPRVSAAGWRRSRTAGAGGKPKRSVHAELRGSVLEVGGDDDVPAIPADARRVTYNPSRHLAGRVPVFHYADNGAEFFGAEYVLVVDGYAYAFGAAS